MGNVTAYRNEIKLDESDIQEESINSVLTKLKNKLERKDDIKSINISNSSIDFVYKVDGNIVYDCSLNAKKTDEIFVLEGELSQEWTKTAQFAICVTFGCAVFFMMVSQNKADSEKVKSLIDSCMRDIELGA